MTRILILSCSATKRTDPGLLPAIDRYQGPLWQTLRLHGPGVTVFALSARYGLLRGDELIPDYNMIMTPDRAAFMAENPICRSFGRVDLPRHPDERGDRWTGLSQLHRLSLINGGVSEVCVVGGRLYQEVGRTIVRDMRMFGFLRHGAPVVTISDEIGRMRQALRVWLQGGQSLFAPAS